MDRLVAARVFVNIVERGSLAAAAEALDLSRPMVSRYLVEMERWMGSRLLHRTTRRISLTPAGETALSQCRRLLDIAEEMVPGALADGATPTGQLRIACSQSLAQHVVAKAMTAFLRQYPRVTVDLQIGSQPVNLVEQRIDLAIRITNDVDPTLIARPLALCESVVCASPSWLARHDAPRTAEDLASHNCLTYSHFGKSLWEFETPGTDSSGHVVIPVSGNLSANEPEVMLAAALEGAGIALLPQYAAAQALASGRLVALLPGYKPRTFGVYGVFASRRQMSGALRAMIDFLAAWFKDARQISL
ncbi:LysR substrate-binding domain-containing protein [Comamonadaceae bacterium PP-2]